MAVWRIITVARYVDQGSYPTSNRFSVGMVSTLSVYHQQSVQLSLATRPWVGAMSTSVSWKETVRQKKLRLCDLLWICTTNRTSVVLSSPASHWPCVIPTPRPCTCRPKRNATRAYLLTVQNMFLLMHVWNEAVYFFDKVR